MDLLACTGGEGGGEGERVGERGGGEGKGEGRGWWLGGGGVSPGRARSGCHTLREENSSGEVAEWVHIRWNTHNDDNNNNGTRDEVYM